MKRRYTPRGTLTPHIDAIREAYLLGGRDCRDIAPDYGVHYTAIQKLLKRTGVIMRPRGHPPGDNGWGGRSRAEVLAAAAARRMV